MSAELTAPAPVNSGDRLGFTLFLALALHALLILGVTFKLSDGKQTPPTLEITLATHKSQQAPEKADFLAQHNQQASGTGKEAKQLTSERDAEFADTQIRETNPRPQLRATDPSKRQLQQQITTSGDSQFKAQKFVKSKDSLEQEKRAGEQVENTQLTTEIASLKAKLDKQRQNIAKRPRRHRMTSVSTKASADAEYLHKWSSKVEFVGNRNFPKEAINKELFGSLRLLTIIKPNGTIHSVEILQSSGHRVLDDAALQIVHLASPFSPFPPEIREKAELLEIIRTWHFEISGLSTTSGAELARKANSANLSAGAN
ncbi:energy transducer TonB [Maricurvus nonylphenolicus]|uniref:energy transducer TonB n=1 Tax=Maricurvus nonylphenolicus TaxID=1008307 RepID=UPI0036F31FCD